MSRYSLDELLADIEEEFAEIKFAEIKKPVTQVTNTSADEAEEKLEKELTEEPEDIEVEIDDELDEENVDEEGDVDNE